MLHGHSPSSALIRSQPFAGLALQDIDEATWGLHATKVLDSRFSGKGIKVAILDTGFDLDHPDFRGRQVKHQSFIAGQHVQDDNGQGTHCIGTACDRAIQPAALATASPMMRRFLSARSSQTRVPRSVASRLSASSGPCVNDMPHHLDVAWIAGSTRPDVSDRVREYRARGHQAQYPDRGRRR